MKSHTTYIASDGKEFFDEEDCTQHEVYLAFLKTIDGNFGERTLNKKEKALLNDVAIIFSNTIVEFMQRLNNEGVTIKNVSITKDRFTNYED